MKLIRTTDHRRFEVRSRLDHPLADHLVLFDTGIRRPARIWGEKVRALMRAGTGHFRHTLAEAVSWCLPVYESAGPKRGMETCLAAYRLLTRYFPGMDLDLPRPAGALGHMLVGAGGGGFGVMWCEDPDARARVAAGLSERGLWAVVPVVLPGATWADGENRLPDDREPDQLLHGGRLHVGGGGGA